MPRSMSDWEREAEDRPVLTAKKIWFWTIGIVVATGVIVTVALWGFGVWTAPWKGQGDAYQQKHSASNWVSAQRGFHQKFNDVQGYKAKLVSARAELAAFDQAHPNVGNGTPYDPLLNQRTNLETTVTGLEQQCQNTVQAYNTDAESYLTEDWRDAKLPSRLETSECTNK